jgi:hypothetical protein
LLCEKEMSERSIPSEIRNLIIDLNFLAMVKADHEPLFRKLPAFYRFNHNLPSDNVRVIGFQIQQLVDRSIEIIDRNTDSQELVSIILDKLEHCLKGLEVIKKIYRKYPEVLSVIDGIITQIQLQTEVEYKVQIHNPLADEQTNEVASSAMKKEKSPSSSEKRKSLPILPKRDSKSKSAIKKESQDSLVNQNKTTDDIEKEKHVIIDDEVVSVIEIPDKHEEESDDENNNPLPDDAE